MSEVPNTVSSARAFEVLNICAPGPRAKSDLVATEEPLEVRLQGAPFIVTMRTPGHDRELIAGFLLAERLIHSRDDLLSLRHCQNTQDEGNVVDVMLTGSAATLAETRLRERRQVAVTSACGVCGRQTIDDLMGATPRLEHGFTVSSHMITSLPAKLRQQQLVFDQTGGLHAAALFASDGRVLGLAEDVGRHNAVDKVIGHQLLSGPLRPLRSSILFVSGRTSFEIVQKAVVAGIPVIAAVSAPSSLAIELARDAGATLIGFVRNATFNVYTGPGRIVIA